ncbi:type II toxin-antitoxin system Phd/YefM family antitoxin [Duganella callida]|uniref:Type II toxin-antitoxin system prevent-host-death family antitoxin n=1 Tax=Duganella callida TaxID=2561932 RepID=A0A4Y9S476_9BURK|nr:type II toxin-antitoxin system prevent-host-death family antitoxin [Duganella callida]TFW16137.1 type II toxin-antitoxin system prevent-host-death family antitoxin [Duganella callida]
MPIVDISVAQTQLTSLLEAARRGEEVILTEAGQPVAELLAMPTPKPFKFGTMKGRIWIAEDFDAPLPADLLAAFEGK